MVEQFENNSDWSDEEQDQNMHEGIAMQMRTCQDVGHDGGTVDVAVRIDVPEHS